MVVGQDGKDGEGAAAINVLDVATAFRAVRPRVRGGSWAPPTGRRPQAQVIFLLSGSAVKFHKYFDG